MEIPLFWFNIFSLAAGFAIALLFVWSKPRSMLLLVALAITLFVLFGIFAIPGFFLGLGAKAFLTKDRKIMYNDKRKRKAG
ncbi:MAG: hypothetical protein QXR53_01875 [Candidatus Norongarragalinales archaeon]